MRRSPTGTNHSHFRMVLREIQRLREGGAVKLHENTIRLENQMDRDVLDLMCHLVDTALNPPDVDMSYASKYASNGLHVAAVHALALVAKSTICALKE